MNGDAIPQKSYKITIKKWITESLDDARLSKAHCKKSKWKMRTMHHGQYRIRKIQTSSTAKGRKHFICDSKLQLKWVGAVHQF